jgi:hypothetical protein
MHILDKTVELMLGYYFEHAALIRKRSTEVLFEEEFYGDPTCGYISRMNDWAIIAGDHVTTWHNETGKRTIYFDERCTVHDLRYISGTQLLLLLDPWSVHASIWKIDVLTMSLQKVRDFPDYHEQEYTESISW